jgi:hypothetical protein
MITGTVSPELVTAIEQSWGTDTSLRGLEYPGNPSRGQCLVTAMVVQDEYGGRLIKGYCGVQVHYWNELPDGTIVDLTRQQFGGKEVLEEQYHEREDIKNKNVLARYEILRDRVSKQLTHSL